MESGVSTENRSHSGALSNLPAAADLPEAPGASIRDAKASDLPYLVAIENACFAGDRLSKRSLQHHLHSANSDLLVAVDDHNIPCGYALLAYRARAKMARLDSLAVLPVHGASGLGSSLLACCERKVRERRVGLRLEVREDNTRAIAFYERRQFRRFGKIPDYYEDGEAALLFYKPFSS